MVGNKDLGRSVRLLAGRVSLGVGQLAGWEDRKTKNSAAHRAGERVREREQRERAEERVDDPAEVEQVERRSFREVARERHRE